MKITIKTTLLFWIALLTSDAIWCQARLTQDDYGKWHTLSATKISADGLWSSYKLTYENAVDTTFIEEIRTGKKLTFPHAVQVDFNIESQSALIHYNNNSFALQNLYDNSAIELEGVEKFEFSNSGKFFVTIETTDAKRKLRVYTSMGKLLWEISAAIDFEINIDDKIAIIDPVGISIFSLSNKERFIEISNTVSPLKNIVWNKSGNVVAFLQVDSSNENNRETYKVCAYNLLTNKLKILDNENLGKNQITDYVQTPIILSDDGTKLFFYFSTETKNVIKNDIVEIWDASSKLVYPAEQIYGNPDVNPKIAVWNLTNNSVKFLSSDELPKSMLTWDYNYALTYSNISHEPQYAMVPPVDIYLTNIENGRKKLLLTKQNISGYSIGCSPSGKLISYYRDRNWWVYDIVAEKHINLTSNLKVAFDEINYDQPGKSDGFISPGWTSDSKYVILYDNYDIWLISPDLKTQRRLTRGAEKKVRFRICDDIYRKSEVVGSADFINDTYDLSKGLLLSATGDNKQTGYYRWNSNGNIDHIIYGEYKFSALAKSQSGQEIIFTKESFEMPPAIYYSEKSMTTSKLLFQSNKHFKNYSLGTSKLINYKNEDGQELHAALFYPPGFEKGKCYPMIVYIYSQLSQEVYNYTNPTMYPPAGFVLSNYTSEGYLVLLPDIRYKVGNPGESILDCVQSAVHTVVAMGEADEKRIGLIGHSYGGYETCHLLTRTPIFAAAVAGAAVTDIISSYLSVNISNGVKMDWRFESQQYRMGSTPFDNLKGYLENSTVTNAANITTPLLSWTGMNDKQCDWRQSVELHLALRRLQRRNIFLVYPQEGHILNSAPAQIDLTTRIKRWFDYYLKDISIPVNNNLPSIEIQHDLE